MRSMRSRCAPISQPSVDVRGDPESLNSAQKVAVFRAVQESLANVREHSGATDGRCRDPCAAQQCRSAHNRQRTGLRGIARPCEGSAARTARSRWNRGARSHARRDVRDREPSGRPDDAPLLVAPVGALHGRRPGAEVERLARSSGPRAACLSRAHRSSDSRTQRRRACARLHSPPFPLEREEATPIEPTLPFARIATAPQARDRSCCLHPGRCGGRDQLARPDVRSS